MNKFKYLGVSTFDALPDEYVIINIVITGLNFEIDNLLQIIIVEYTRHGEIKEYSFTMTDCNFDTYKYISHKLNNKYVISCNPKLLGKFIYSNLNRKVDLPNINFVFIDDLLNYFQDNIFEKSHLSDFFERETHIFVDKVLKNISKINNEFLSLKRDILNSLDEKISSLDL